ncbi:MAG: hypothetical protein WC593_15695 [Methanoregula sp.]
MDENQASQPLPQWQSHKQVGADKIVGIVNDGDFQFWSLACGIPVHVSSHLKERCGNNDPVGGYYVLYVDGFESWSPAKAFKEGYTRIG